MGGKAQLSVDYSQHS